MHTFARALFGPLLAGNGPNTRNWERRLLGAQGGVKVVGSEPGATFRIEVEPHPLNSGNYLNCPHNSGKGRRSGFDEGQTAALIIRPRPAAVVADPQLPAMLWTVLWTGLAFGSLGNRCRRGYGSLTVTGIQAVGGGAPPPVLGFEEGTQALPTWPDLPKDENDLACTLHAGFKTAQAVATAWLPLTLPRGSRSGGRPPFFQLLGSDLVYMGRVYSTCRVAMAELMGACHRELGNAAGLYRKTMGAGGSDRLASPLWVRLYRTEAGWVPLATFSGDPDPSSRKAVDNVLTAIGAAPASRSLTALATGRRC